jgi:hypothetical protein
VSREHNLNRLMLETALSFVAFRAYDPVAVVAQKLEFIGMVPDVDLMRLSSTTAFSSLEISIMVFVMKH